jgi:hypothetical protein
MFAHLLNAKNGHDFVYADSEYSIEFFHGLLNLGGSDSLIHDKVVRNHQQSIATKELKCIPSEISACEELVFGGMTTTAGELTKKIGLKRIAGRWGIMNMAFNFLLYRQRNSSLTLAVYDPTEINFFLTTCSKTYTTIVTKLPGCGSLFWIYPLRQ